MRRLALVLMMIMALLAAGCGSSDPGVAAQLDVGDASTPALPDPDPDPDGVAVPDPDPDPEPEPEPEPEPDPEPRPEPEPDPDPKPVPDPEPEPGNVSGEAGRALAAASALEQSSFRMDVVAEFGGIDELGGDSVSFSVSSAFSADGRSGMMRMDLGDVLAAAAQQDPVEAQQLAALFGEPIEMRFIGDTTYMTSTFFSWLFPVQTPWIAMTDTTQTQDMGLDRETFSAEEFLSVLRAIDGEPEIVGVEVIDGVTTTHIRGTVSAAGLAAAGGASVLEDLDPTGAGVLDVDAFDIDVWIGEDDILRRMRFGVDDLAAFDPTAPDGAFFVFTLDFTSVGEPVVVEPPPADEITWIDDLLGDFGFVPD